MKFIKLNLYRTLLMCAGFMISAFGSALYVYSGLGADAFNLMVQGVSGVLGLAIGTTSSLIQFIFLALLIFASRPLIGIGTFGGTVLIGMVMNLCEIFLQPQLAHAGLLMRVLCVMLAPIIVGTGVAMVNLASMGMAPNDILSVWLFTRQKKLPYRAVRIIYDVVQLAIGLALGGVVGIGTVLSAVLTGPAIQAASGVQAHAPADADRIAQINIAHILFLLHMMDTPLVDSLKRGVYRSVQKNTLHRKDAGYLGCRESVCDRKAG